QKPAHKHLIDFQKTSYYSPEHLSPKQLDNRRDHLFIHALGYDPVDVALSLQTDKKTLYIAGYEHTLQKLHQAFPDAFQLLSPYSYLSEERLQSLWKKEQLDDAETSLLLKTILHPRSTTKEEFILTHPERAIWRHVNVSETEVEGQENTYTKAYAQSLQSRKVIASQFHVLSDLDYVKNFEQVVILEPHLLEDNATSKFGKLMYLDQWTGISSDPEWVKAGEY